MTVVSRSPDAWTLSPSFSVPENSPPASEVEEGRVGSDAVPDDRAVVTQVVVALRYIENAHEGCLVGGQRERAVGRIDLQVAHDAASGEATRRSRQHCRPA